MIENVKIPIDHHTILVFWLFQNLLILSHLSESSDVPAGCMCIGERDYLSRMQTLLPPAMKLGQGYVFTGVCHSINRGVCQGDPLEGEPPQPPGGRLPTEGEPPMPLPPGGVCPGGVSAQRGCLPRACVSQHALGRGVSAPVHAAIQTRPRGQNSWHTLVKTLPFCNYVKDGNNI